MSEFDSLVADFHRSRRTQPAASVDRGPGSQFNTDATALGIVMAQPETTFLDLPDPMPATTADGTNVWLHYRPLRWERHA